MTETDWKTRALAAEARLKEMSPAPYITKTTKPGKACYCDVGCTPKQCSAEHDNREVMIELF